MDEECKHRDNISKGMKVTIAIHKSAPQSEWIEGIVKEIVDSKLINEYGVLVKINEYNAVGHVKKILERENFEEGLTETEILQMIEGVRNETHFETKKFELKETFWYDVNASEHANQPTKNLKLEYVVVDEICAFLNTSGGYILIGVTNNGVLKGITLERDLQWMGEGKKDLDHFADMISSKLHGKYFKDDATSRLVTVKPQIINGYPIIVIHVKKSYKPFFVHKKGTFKDENGFEKSIDYMECVVRRETGIDKITFDSFMEFWLTERS